MSSGNDTAIGRALALIIVGCMTNVLFLEVIIKIDPASGGLITLSQFLFVTMQGVGSQISFGKSGQWTDSIPRFTQRTIPLWVHILTTLIFFSVSTMNNWALNYNISMPLHMIFRASSLMASLVLGYFLFGKSYSGAQISGVVLVTLGITVTTLADSKVDALSLFQCACGQVSHCPSNSLNSKEDDEHFETWLIGIVMLTFALFGSALLGHLQEWSYRKWGRDANESKFYSHALSLPYFYFLTHNDITTRIEHWNQSPSLRELTASDPLTLLPATALLQRFTSDFIANSVVGQIPLLYVFLLGNVLTQFVCISGVYQLTAFASTLTCTMALTVRKFLSLVLSVWLFANPFSRMHWTGTALVFAGVVQYSQVIQQMIRSNTHKKVD